VFGHPPRAALLRSANRFVRQQQRSEIMQCFELIVNFFFASNQFPDGPYQLNYLISLSFSIWPSKREANYSKPARRSASPARRFREKKPASVK
jgi:hypothetical protein